MPVRIIRDQSGADYHAEMAHISSSYIKDWGLRSPAHAEHGEKTINPYVADEGTAIHLVFEGRDDLVIEAGETRRGSGWEEAKKRAASIGGVALPKKAYATAIAAGRSARSHPTIAKWFTDYKVWHEASVYAIHAATGQGVKTKPDVYLPETGAILDLKSAVSADPRDFIRACFKYGYDLQAAFYRMVCREAGLRVSPNFHILAVEKTRPFAAQHFVMESDVLSAAEERVEQIMLEIAHSRETGVFSTGWPPVSKINLNPMGT